MRRTKEAADQTRSAILDAAETVFFERGVSQTSLTHIASAAGCTRGAIYWHFRGKSDLFMAMRERAFLPQEEFFEAQDILNDPDPLGALLRTTIESLKRFAADERAKRVTTILVLRCEYVGEMEEATLCQREADDRMRRNVRDALERAATLGQLDPAWDAERATDACVCAYTGLFTHWLRSSEGFDLAALGAQVFDSLFQGLRAPGSAAGRRLEAAE